MKQTWSWAALALILGSCAPGVSGPLTSDTLFEPSPVQAQAICPSVRASENGLTWRGAAGIKGQVPPYLLRCPDFTLSDDAQVLSIQAGSLDAALHLFADDAYALTYLADQRLRFPEAGLISADPWTNLDDVTQERELGVSVRVTAAGGQSGLLLSRGKVTPLRYDPQQPVTLEILNNPALNWRKYQIEAARGLVRAYR